MPTAQPDWEFLGNLGDSDPIDNGGYFVYRDRTGVYGFEAERLEEPPEDARQRRWTIYRVLLERFKVIRFEAGGETCRAFVPINWTPDWRPASGPASPVVYQPWFFDSLDEIADTHGTTKLALMLALCSNDWRRLAWAYECIYGHHGWENGDEYPLVLDRRDVLDRYRRDELK